MLHSPLTALGVNCSEHHRGPVGYSRILINQVNLDWGERQIYRSDGLINIWDTTWKGKNCILVHEPLMNEEMDWDSTPVWEMMALGKKTQRWEHSTRHSTSQAPRHGTSPLKGRRLLSEWGGVRGTNHHSMLLSLTPVEGPGSTSYLRRLQHCQWARHSGKRLVCLLHIHGEIAGRGGGRGTRL